jgi:hypothetical protein
LRKFHVDYVSKLLLSVIGDTHRAVFAIKAQPFVGFRVVEFVGNVHLLGLVKMG